MTNQIETIMALVVEYGVYPSDELHHAIESALEAALKPGEPFGHVNTRTGQFFKDVEDCRQNNEGHWRTVYTAATPAQTPPKGLFVDLIAQHPGLAEELKAIDDAPMPTWTPPPRLTTKQHNELWNSYLSGKSDGITYSEFLETAVRRQFLGMDES